MLAAGRLKELMLFEAARRSPGLVLGEGVGLGLIRRGLLRLGVGLAAGRMAVDLSGLFPGLPTSPLVANGAGVMRDRIGLAAGRGEALGRVFCVLVAGLIATEDPKVDPRVDEGEEGVAGGPATLLAWR